MRAAKKKVQATRLLPEEFKDLEPFVDAWALRTEEQRNRKRLSSPMAEIQALYDAMLLRIEAITNYLNQIPLNSMPENAQRLFLLCLSFAEIATAAELFKQPTVVDGFDPTRFVRVDVPNMTPHLQFEGSEQQLAGSERALE